MIHGVDLIPVYAPRNKVITWAKTIVEQHPQHNIILNTHAHLSTYNLLADTITTPLSQDTGEEYANDGVNVREKLVSQYPNFLFVFNGHVGGVGHLIGDGVNGNKVYQFHANYDGQVVADRGMMRIVDMDTDNRSFSIRTYSPYYNTSKPEEFVQFTDVNFIKDGSSGTKDNPSDKIKFMLNGKSLTINNAGTEDITISVFNLQGVKIIERAVNGTENITSPASGCYIIRAVDKSRNVVLRKKILIK